MKKSRFTESQVVAIFKEADGGLKVAEVCRKHGISQPTYCNWKSRYWGLGVSELKHIRELEAEHARLKRCMPILRWRTTRPRNSSKKSSDTNRPPRGGRLAHRGTKPMPAPDSTYELFR